MLRYPQLLDVIGKPLFSRLTHRHAIRHATGVGLGIGLMLIGSTVAHNAHAFGSVPAILTDAVAYWLHGFGAIPIYQHVMPLWHIVADVSEGV